MVKAGNGWGCVLGMFAACALTPVPAKCVARPLVVDCFAECFKVMKVSRHVFELGQQPMAEKKWFFRKTVS